MIKRTERINNPKNTNDRVYRRQEPPNPISPRQLTFIKIGSRSLHNFIVSKRIRSSFYKILSEASSQNPNLNPSNYTSLFSTSKFSSIPEKLFVKKEHMGSLGHLSSFDAPSSSLSHHRIQGVKVIADIISNKIAQTKEIHFLHYMLENGGIFKGVQVLKDIESRKTLIFMSAFFKILKDLKEERASELVNKGSFSLFEYSMQSGINNETKQEIDKGSSVLEIVKFRLYSYL